MPTPLTIPKAKSPEAAFTHERLFAAGLEHVQRLASRLWTDYNVHDPGITILELLCYALTDLSYRASFPVPDLLAGMPGEADPAKQSFFTARQILPNRPWTALDYRKLLIDLPGVKNAWLEPASPSCFADPVSGTLSREHPGRPEIKEVKLRGLYDVLIDYLDDLPAADQPRVLKQVRQCLHANRNLCEDFVSVAEVATQDFLLCAELELAPEADPSRVLGEIWFQVQQYLAPAVANYSLSEMLARTKSDGTPWTVDEIFDGPALDCGFIDSQELARAELRTDIRLSDVISLLMDLDGVLAVRDIVVNPRGTVTPLEDTWRVPMPARTKALLDREHSRVVFYKRNLPVLADRGRALEHFTTRAQAARAKAETVFKDDLTVPPGQNRRAGEYYSFQNHFPALYGLSEVGVPGAGDPKAGQERESLALQLKAYLLFFDQAMANYFAQLRQVGALFSNDPGRQRTYFTQVVDSFRDYQKVYREANPAPALEALIEDPATFARRRNRFLDHLIARFAERFHEYAHLVIEAFGARPQDLVRLKCEFLTHYPAIGSERGLAYNYSLKSDADLWNSANVSGLERRLAHLLGIRNFSRRNLGEITYDIYAEVDATPGDEFRFRVRHRDTGAIVLSSSTKYATRKLAKAEMQRALGCALTPAGYERKVAADGTHYFNVIESTGEVLARRIEYFPTPAAMDEAIAELMEYLRVNYSDEGLYLIEAILLRPEANADPFLPICPDPNCTECADLDPYSYRVHVILPAYSSRFRNMDFRRYAEEVIRTEMPAHILPRICWISRDDMAILEKAYRDWISLKAGAEKTQRTAKLKAFYEALYAVRNVYPAQKLHPCDSTVTESKFLLGQTALGTLTDET